MNRSYFFGAVLVAIASIQSFSLFAGNEQTWSTPVYLTVPNDGSLDASRDIHMTLQIEGSALIRSMEVRNPKNGTVEDIRTAQFKDGKVDVDIIIRGGTLLPFLRPLSVKPYARIEVLNISYITVDNISGVYQANTSPSVSVQPRLSNIYIYGAGDSEMNVSNNLGATLELSGAMLENQTSSSIRNENAVVASEIALYPNPVRDGNLFIRVPETMGTISQISVLNALGGLVKQFRPESTYGAPVQLPLEGISAGVYFVRISSASGEVVKKFNIAR